MTREKTERILELLDIHYPTELECYLNYSNAWQLLFATILSAQCTDDRVNIVTENLYKKYLSLKDFASADIMELEIDIKSTGFYHNKAKNIIGCAKILLEKYGGEVPSNIDELVALPGVGRKTANVVRGHIFGIPSIVVDTHVKRLSNRLGFVDEQDPVKIEMALYKILPEQSWIKYNLQLIAHGRKVCKSQNPKCFDCFFNDDGLCPYPAKLNKKSR